VDAERTGPTDGLVDEVLDHYARHLGPPTRLDHLPSGLHLVTWIDRPMRGAVTHATAGLSAIPLTQATGIVRQELLIAADAGWEAPAIGGLLSHLAGQVALMRRPLLFGEAFPLDFPVRGLPDIEGFVAIDPRYHPDALYIASTREGPVAITWLVPITPAEVGYVTTAGIDAFLVLVAEQQPNLLKVRRRSIRGID
jgi:hypothetical protein